MCFALLPFSTYLSVLNYFYKCVNKMTIPSTFKSGQNCGYFRKKKNCKELLFSEYSYYMTFTQLLKFKMSYLCRKCKINGLILRLFVLFRALLNKLKNWKSQRLSMSRKIKNRYVAQFVMIYFPSCRKCRFPLMFTKTLFLFNPQN